MVEDERRDQAQPPRAGENVERGEDLTDTGGAQPRHQHLGGRKVEAHDAGRRDPPLTELPLEALQVSPPEDEDCLDPGDAHDG